jgi:hypothetical protein
MTQASEILSSARNSSEGMDAAAKTALETDQDWSSESTIYTFADGSVLVASGAGLNAYAGPVWPQYKVDADRVTGEWIGGAEFVDYVTRSDWNAKVDSYDVNYDTYESDDQTRAIEVTFC